MKKSVLIFIVFIGLNSCDFVCNISLENKSNTDIYTFCNNDELFRREGRVSIDSSAYEKNIINSHTTNVIKEWLNSDPEKFLTSTDTISIFILDKNEYEGKTWKQIVDSAKYKQIYHLSGDDIRRLDSKIPYPPSEVMRDMDMEPPYSEQKESD